MSQRIWRARPVACHLLLCLLLLPLPALADGTPRSAANALLDKADVIAAKVASLRGLRLERPIERGVMDKEQVRARLLQRVDEEYSPEELAAEEVALKRLGLLPADADYKQLAIDLLSTQIAGFYDPAERRLYIAGWHDSTVAAGADMLMAHEIDHALQDQHFELKAFMKPDKNNGDASVARQALVEGDGTALMVEYMLGELGAGPPWADARAVSVMAEQMTATMAGQLDQVPLVLREGLIFPYLHGLLFVAHVRKLHSWARVDAIYKKPPLSTEHILHPDKYEAYERPVAIHGGALRALPNYEIRYDNVTGELGMAILLRQHTAERATQRGDVPALTAKAERAAAGWGGDRMILYAPPGQAKGSVAGTALVSYSVWDTEADAIELFETLSQAMPGLAGGTAVMQTGERVEYQGSGQATIAERRGSAVVLVLGATSGKAAAVMAEVWKTWKPKRR